MKTNKIDKAKLKRIVIDFSRKNLPMKGKRKKWKDRNPLQYEAVKILFKKGFTLVDIAKYFKVHYMVIRLHLIDDKILKTRKYTYKANKKPKKY